MNGRQNTRRQGNNSDTCQPINHQTNNQQHQQTNCTASAANEICTQQTIITRHQLYADTAGAQVHIQAQSTCCYSQTKQGRRCAS